MEPTADTCPCVDSLQFTAEDSAVPIRPKSSTSAIRHSTSAAVNYQPKQARYTSPTPSATKQISNVAAAVERK